jgi:hypothetical protein
VRDGFGQPSGGIHGTGQDVDDGATGCLAAQPGLDQRPRVRGDVPEDHGRAVDQHHDDVGVDRRHRFESGELVGRQIHMGAVEAL